MKKPPPRVLDLFCGAGGAAEGLRRAGLDVVLGVDIVAQPNYPFEFARGDAMRWPLAGFDFIWASPPCQNYSLLTNVHGRSHPDLIAGVRRRLKRSGVHWVMENVPQAPLRDPVCLCGTSFGLRVQRHRHFEASFSIRERACGEHGYTASRRGGWSTYEKGAELITVVGNGFIREQGASAMGIHWMKNRHELAEAIPPAYAEYVGREFMRNVWWA